VVPVETDAGRAILKVLGNPQGPHALVCELIGTRLAEALGLPVLSSAILELPAGVQVSLRDGCFAQAGPCWATRFEPHARVWDSTQQTLSQLVNDDDVTRLVILDTLLRNPDRFERRDPQFPTLIQGNRRPNYDNVMLRPAGAGEPAVELVAFDFTSAFYRTDELSRRLFTIEHLRDGHVFGLFPGFEPHLSIGVAEDFLRRLPTTVAASLPRIFREVPGEWECSRAIVEEMQRFLIDRAHWLAEGLVPSLSRFGQRDKQTTLVRDP
jgi:hypothetical protein